MKDAARRMKTVDCGVLPVGEKPDKVVGMITDRDIVLRVTAEGKDPAKIEELKLLKAKQAKDLLKLGIRQNENALLCGRFDGQPL